MRERTARENKSFSKKFSCRIPVESLLGGKGRLKSLSAYGDVGDVVASAFDADGQVDLVRLPGARGLLLEHIAVEAHVHVFHAEADADLLCFGRGVFDGDVEGGAVADRSGADVRAVGQDAAFDEVALGAAGLGLLFLPPVQQQEFGGGEEDEEDACEEEFAVFVHFRRPRCHCQTGRRVRLSRASGRGSLKPVFRARRQPAERIRLVLIFQALAVRLRRR